MAVPTPPAEIVAPTSNAYALAVAPVNIALIKYWGKRGDRRLNLPAASSLSLTLHDEEGESLDDVLQPWEEGQLSLPEPENSAHKASPASTQLVTITRVTLLPAAAESIADELWLNNERVPSLNERIRRVLQFVRSLRPLPAVRIQSINRFPTAAGLASSASGYAALAMALGELVGLSPSERYLAARLGSGSACRSMLGGFVKWVAGERADGEDSLPHSSFESDHWPELAVTVLLLEEGPKETSSGEGMERTLATSTLFPTRLQQIESSIEQLQRAIRERDFALFAEIVMRDSNQFHASCLDSYPPLLYLNGRSLVVMRAIHQLNGQSSTPLAAYTFDAGPNAFLFYLRPNRRIVEAAVNPVGDIPLIRCKVGPGARIVSSERVREAAGTRM